MAYSKSRLAWRQFAALCRKNWIVLGRHWLYNLARCLLVPIAFAFFMAKAEVFFAPHGQLGLGNPAPIRALDPELLGLKLVWVPPAAALYDSNVNDYADQFMGRVLQGVNPARVQKVYNASLVQNECPCNYALRSSCFAAVVITSLIEGSDSFVYTLRGDGGNNKVHVKDNQGDLETRFLPLQWALDSTFIEMRSGNAPPLPTEWPFTRQSMAQQAEANRQGYLSGILSLIVLALYLNFLGIVYHLPGAIASERSAQLTSHMEAMGLLKRAKILSWHVSLSLAYLPAWIITAVVWRTYIWERTSYGLLIVFFILIGLANASWTFLVAAPFHKLPTLAAIAAVFLAIVFNIVALISRGAGAAIILSIVFPPAVFTFVVKAITRQERRSMGAGWLSHDAASPFPLVVYLVILIFDIVAFPLLAVWLENRLYGVRKPGSKPWYRRVFRRNQQAEVEGNDLPDNVAVRLTNISKVFVTRPWWSCGQRVKRHTAIESLTMDFANGDINVLLGRNGASKSTTISILSGLLSSDGGSISYSASSRRIGIAPQQNVLWNELTCRQHITLWLAIKAKSHDDIEIVDDILDRADLSKKKADLASNLSGGQKRKLQLAAALAARSQLIVLDECTTGVDPLSRHALWKTILSCRGHSTVILTTHFLDEADILGDYVSMLRAPGKLLGNLPPTAWKTGSHGQGYAVGVSDPTALHDKTLDLTTWIASVQTAATVSQIKLGEYLIRPIRSEADVSQILDSISRHNPALQLDVHATSLEEVFMQVTSDRSAAPLSTPAFVIDSDPNKEKDGMLTEDSLPTPVPEKQDFDFHGGFAISQAPLALTPGRHISPTRQAVIITYKRFLTLRQTYLMPLIGVLMLCFGVLIPVVFLTNGRYYQTCERIFDVSTELPLTKPLSQFARSPAIAAPPTALTNLPAQFGFLPAANFTFLSDLQAFNENIATNYTRTRYGGVYLDDQNNAKIAYEARALTNTGLSVLNLASNSILNRAASLRGYNIITSFSYFAALDFSSTGQGIKYVAFFSLSFACFVAFFTLAPTSERRLSVKGNLFANGVLPSSYWLGQLMADACVFTVAVAIVTIGLAATVKANLAALGLLWLCMELYCVAGALFSYVFSLFLDSSLAAWALCAAWNVIWFLLYFAANLLLLTFDQTASVSQHLTVVYFAMGFVAPIIPLMRAILVSLNMFSFLCDGLGNRSSSPYGVLPQFGGPILYLFVWILALYAILVYVDSGSPLPRLRRQQLHPELFVDGTAGKDVAAEAEAVSESSAAMRVLGLSKAYNKKAIAVKNVSFQVDSGQTFALIGPNGAGKTSALSCIQGSLAPSHGDVFLHGKSITHERNQARASIGICPQINPFDDLSVEEHLIVYGRLKGLNRSNLRKDIGILLDRTGLRQYQFLRAGALSGGNKRKLCLALALIGSPGILSVDEFSSGVDSYARRENYALLRSMSADKAVIFTTHSMEEVENMADRVCVLAGKLLAIGSVGDLKRRYQAFEIHLTSDKTEECLAYVQQAFPGSRRMLDTASRFEVPVADGNIAELFRVMAEAKAQLGIDELAIQRLSMESTFIKIIQQHGVREENEGEDLPLQRKRRWLRRS